MIEIIDAYKALGGKDILKEVNIKVPKGSIFGLIGPNGAGKTTLIKSITGIYNLDKGQIKIMGEEVYENPPVKKSIGYVADDNSYFNSFKIIDLINFYKLSYEKFSKDRFDELNKIFKIPENTAVRKLSKGMRTRLAIMLNLSIMPEVLILDEPTSGLDPIAKKQLFNILIDDAAERETTIFISSHNLSDLERICDSVAIMYDGQIKYSNSIEEMKKNIRKLQVVFKNEAPKDLENWEEVIHVSKIGRVYNIITKEYSQELLRKLRGFDLLLEEEIDLSLEDMFIYSIGGEKEYEGLF